MKGKCIVCKIFGLLMIVGALNWGLVGIFQLDLVAKLFGGMTMISRIIYGLIGVSGAVALIGFVKDCPACKKG